MKFILMATDALKRSRQFEFEKYHDRKSSFLRKILTPKEIRQLIKSTEGGDIEAMYALAVIYRDENGIKQDFEKFLHWLMCLRKRLGFSVCGPMYLSIVGACA